MKATGASENPEIKTPTTDIYTDIYDDFHRTVGKLHDIWRDYLKSTDKEKPASQDHRVGEAGSSKKHP